VRHRRLSGSIIEIGFAAPATIIIAGAEKQQVVHQISDLTRVNAFQPLPGLPKRHIQPLIAQQFMIPGLQRPHAMITQPIRTAPHQHIAMLQPNPLRLSGSQDT
jgi:hypothetical protein